MGDKKRWLGLIAISLGVAGIIVDATIVNVAIPAIIENLKVTATQTQWIQEAYTLVFASTLLVFGTLSDKFGRRALFMLGMLVFVASSMAAAQANSGEFLIQMRLIQGIGGAMMLPTSLSLLNSTFFGKERGIAFAVWGSTIGGAAALGPLIGGWLTTNLSWRWAFGINLPLGIVVISGALLFIKESKGESQSGADYVGALMSVLTMGSLVYALIEGRNLGWWRSLEHDGISNVPYFVASFILFLALFIKIQISRNKSGKPVLLDLSLLKINSFRNGNIAAAIISLGEFGLIFALPLWLQNVRGYSAFDSGLVLLALAIGSFMASGAGAGLTSKLGATKIVQMGIALELIGVFGIGFFISPSVSIWLIAGALFIYGMGVGLATAQLTGVILVDVPVERSGQASGMQSTSRQLGSALGIALLGTVLFSSFSSGLGSDPSAKPLVKSAGAMISKLPPASKELASQAFSTAASHAAYFAALFLFFGFLATFKLGKQSPRK